MIESTNDCGEKRYIDFPVNDEVVRREQLEILYKKCKELLSFLSRKHRDCELMNGLYELMSVVNSSLHNNDDIESLYEEFNMIKSNVKSGSISSLNLSCMNMI